MSGVAILLSRSIIKKFFNGCKRDGKYIAWQDVFDADGNYVLTDEVNAIYAKSASERKRMDSDLLKLDESVNIVYRIMQYQLVSLPGRKRRSGKMVLGR